MTSAALFWGSGLLAFGPILALLSLLVYKKAQLVIVVTTSAFAYLLSALLASIAWWIFSLLGLNNPVFVLLPGVFAQFLLRCGFVALYHKVEEVIEISVRRHEEQQNRGNGAENHDGQNTAPQDWTETAQLRLELNDWACGIAAGTGFGGMHAILLYGTLLASESGNIGTLYQVSCPEMPGLMLSAINALLFSLLDMLWMLFTFFGMRLRKSGGNSAAVGGFGSFLGYSKKSGNLSLGICIITHLAASFATIPNNLKGGCKISIPLLVVIVAATFFSFRAGVYNTYLPANQRRRVAE